MKQRLQKLAILGLTVVTIMGTVLPVSVAAAEDTVDTIATIEEIPQEKMYVFQATLIMDGEVVESFEEQIPESAMNEAGGVEAFLDMFKAELEKEAEKEGIKIVSFEPVIDGTKITVQVVAESNNTTPEVIAPTVQPSATWDGKGDVILEVNNGTAELKSIDSVIILEGHAKGFSFDFSQAEYNAEEGTFTISESLMKEAITDWETQHKDHFGEEIAFKKGTVDVRFFFVENDEKYHLSSKISVNLGNDGQTSPEEDNKPQTNPEEDNKPQTNPEEDNKPQTNPEGNNKPQIKPQTNNTTTAPKTGDVANVTGLMGTCAGSLGVALMAFKRRFRK